MFTKKTTLIIPTRNRPYFLLKLLKNLKNLKIKFIKLKYCKQKQNGRNYCFRIPKDSLCKKGKIVTKLDECDFY